MSERPDDAASVGDALAKLREAMRSAAGGTADPDRRRAAAMLAELTRSDDDDLARFTQRHLPGRDVAEGTVRELRDLLVGVARLLSVQGRAPRADALVGSLRNTLYARIEELEQAAKRESGAPLLASAAAASPAPAPVVDAGPAVAAGPVRVMPSYLQPSATPAASPWRPEAHGAPVAPPRVAPPAAVAAPGPVTLPPATAPAASRAGAFVGPGFVASAPVALPRVEPAMQIEDEGTCVADVEPDSASMAGTGLPFVRTATPPRMQAVPFDVEPPPPSRPAPVAPFVPDVTLPSHLRAIDLRSHATLTAMLQVFPERTVDVCHQYGLVDPSERALLDDHWYGRFRRLPHEREEWARYRDHAIAHYRGGR